MSVARFIADQRTMHRVPHTLTCALLGVSLAWFYKWHARARRPSAATGLFTTRDFRRDTIDRAVRIAFRKARGLHRSRLHADLRGDGWTVSEKTVADLMARQPGPAPDQARPRVTSEDKTKSRPLPDCYKELHRRSNRMPSGSVTSPRSPRWMSRVGRVRSCIWRP